MKIGVCVDPFRPCDVTGFDLVRVVAFDEPDAVKFVHEIIAQGIDVALVLARESMGDNPSAWRNLALKYNKLYRPTYLVVGNEADAYLLGEPSPSSWSMEPDEYQVLLDSVVYADNLLPIPELVVGGLVSGQPTWLNELVAYDYDSIDVHPYGKDPTEAANLIAMYKEVVPGMGIHVLEFNTTTPTEYKAAMEPLLTSLCWFHYDYAEFALTPEIKATLIGGT